MFLHRRPICASGLGQAWLRFLLGISLAGLVAVGSASADTRKPANKAGEVDTEHMFGFTEGSNIGKAGEKELETDSTGRFGKFDGSYNNVATALEAKYSFSDRFRLSAVATVAYYDIAGVSGFDDARQA